MPKANDKDVYYFSHDCNARNDDKILALRSVYGLEGYAIYFMIIEILREQPTYKLPISKYTWNTLAMQMQCESKTVESIVHDCCNEFVNENSSLLKIEDGFLYSESLLRRMEKVDNTSESRSKAANIRWQKEKQYKGNANVQQKECNKKRIDKKRKEKIKLDDNKKEENILSSGNQATYIEIIEYLNKVLGTNYKASTKSTKEHINARLSEGYKFDDFKIVIDKKYNEWHKKPDMAQYLRPQTLFGTKFESYLNQPWHSCNEQKSSGNPFLDMVRSGELK